MTPDQARRLIADAIKRCNPAVTEMNVQLDVLRALIQPAAKPASAKAKRGSSKPPANNEAKK
ncbi:MAG: hypothetical protein AAF958_14215 [Planctomycetota bacterium]